MESFPNLASAPRTAASVSALTATGRAPTSSATTSSTSWAPAASNALTVTNGAFVPRLRLYWVDVRKGGWEFLAGQSWSMLTPNRVGISPLPGDLFYSQVMDVNYMAGLTWTRQPGMRVLYHFGDKARLGLVGGKPRPVYWRLRQAVPRSSCRPPIPRSRARNWTRTASAERGAPAHTGLHQPSSPSTPVPAFTPKSPES